MSFEPQQSFNLQPWVSRWARYAEYTKELKILKYYNNMFKYDFLVSIQDFNTKYVNKERLILQVLKPMKQFDINPIQSTSSAVGRNPQSITK